MKISEIGVFFARNPILNIPGSQNRTWGNFLRIGRPADDAARHRRRAIALGPWPSAHRLVGRSVGWFRMVLPTLWTTQFILLFLVFYLCFVNFLLPAFSSFTCFFFFFFFSKFRNLAHLSLRPAPYDAGKEWLQRLRQRQGQKGQRRGKSRPWPAGQP